MKKVLRISFHIFSSFISACALVYLYAHKEEVASFFSDELPITVDSSSSTSGSQEFASKKENSEEVLEQLIKIDFSNLIQKQFLKDNFLDVSKTWYHLRTQKIRSSFQKNDNFMPTQDQGTYFVNAEIYDFPDDNFESYLVQYNWINSKTNNKDWEMNRVYKVRKLVSKNQPIKSTSKK